VVTLGIRAGGQAAGLPTSFSSFFFLVKKKDTFKQEFIVLFMTFKRFTPLSGQENPDGIRRG